MNTITQAWGAFVRLIRPDVDAIISSFLKAQSKLDLFIKREEAKLAKEAASIEALITSQVRRNRVVDRAYRIIHNLDGIIA
jgi:hypothetical protein